MAAFGVSPRQLARDACNAGSYSHQTGVTLQEPDRPGSQLTVLRYLDRRSERVYCLMARDLDLEKLARLYAVVGCVLDDHLSVSPVAALD